VVGFTCDNAKNVCGCAGGVRGEAAKTVLFRYGVAASMQVARMPVKPDLLFTMWTPCESGLLCWRFCGGNQVAHHGSGNETPDDTPAGSKGQARRIRVLGGVGVAVVALVGVLPVVAGQADPFPSTSSEPTPASAAVDAELVALDAEQNRNRALVSRNIRNGFVALQEKQAAEVRETERAAEEQAQAVAEVEAARVAAEQARITAATTTTTTTTTKPPPSPPPTTTTQAPSTSQAPPPTALPAPPPAVPTPPPPGSGYGVWDALAACESGGNWAMNSGNGFYGGLQFMHATWLSMGGDRYAAYPHQATRVQQIDIAAKLQARYGWGQWPACSTKLGLR
jgi:hypothetical protein